MIIDVGSGLVFVLVQVQPSSLAHVTSVVDRLSEGILPFLRARRFGEDYAINEKMGHVLSS